MYSYLDLFSFFLRQKRHIIIRIIVKVMTITLTPPSTLVQMIFMLTFSVSAELGLIVPFKLEFKQSSSINDSTFVKQVGSTVYTVPVTLIDDPLLIHEEKIVTRSFAV